jgi:MFS family permease
MTNHTPDAQTTPERTLPVFRLFWFFLPETSLLREFRFQLVVVSRFLSEVGQESVFYGALVAATIDGSAFNASIIGAAKMIPAATLGLFGGAVADALPKRVALGLGYATQAALCVILPLFFGTDFWMLVVLTFAISVLNQLLGPGENAAIPLVSSREQIPTAASMISLSDAIATGIGMAAVAPVVLKVWGVDVLFYVSAGFLGFAAIRIFALPLERDISVTAALRRLRISDQDFGLGKTLRWLLSWPAVSTMIVAGLVVTTLGMIMETLAPTYVEEVLHTNPANTVYVFAPAGLGALIALGGAPKFIDLIGERRVTAIAVAVQTAALFSMAFIDELAPVLAPISPLRILELFGVELSDAVLAASLVSLFTGFAASLASISVQTYINRRVPMLQQGRTFGLQTILANTVALLPMLFFGAMASATSMEAVLFWAPWIMMVATGALLLLAQRFSPGEPPRGWAVLSSFWDEEASEVDTRGASAPQA